MLHLLLVSAELYPRATKPSIDDITFTMFDGGLCAVYVWDQHEQAPGKGCGQVYDYGTQRLDESVGGIFSRNTNGLPSYGVSQRFHSFHIVCF